MSDKKKIQKAQHDRFKEIEAKINKGESTTFAERNAYNVHLRNKKKKLKQQHGKA